jgi:hypothetical protein
MKPPSDLPVSTPARTVNENRRRGNRHRLHIPATLVAEGGHPTPIAVTITELAIGGVGIRAKHDLKVDGIYHLNSFDTLIPPGMRVHIVSKRKLPDETFDVGAKAI